MSQPELQLAMIPGDGRFVPYKDAEKSNDSTTKSPTNGRIFVLKFSSSKDRHFFWMQAKSQHSTGDPSWFSPRDLKIGSIVDRIIQGDDFNVEEEINNMDDDQEDAGGGDGDAEMEDVAPENPGSGAASGGPAGGVRGETSGSGGGGADGGNP